MSLNIAKDSKKRVVIVGGGFGGLKLANKLKKSGFQVVLIDKNNYHQFPPLIYQVASAGMEPTSISFPFRKIFQHRKDFYFRMAEVRAVFPEKNMIQTSIGKAEYDYLVLAAGKTGHAAAEGKAGGHCRDACPLCRGVPPYDSCLHCRLRRKRWHDEDAAYREAGPACAGEYEII